MSSIFYAQNTRRWNVIALSASVALLSVMQRSSRGEEHGVEHHDEVHLSEEAIRRNGVVVERVARLVLTPTFVVPGRVGFNAEEMAHVGSVMTGRVREIHARVGAHVAKGDPLLTIESVEFGEAQSAFLERQTLAETARPAVALARSAHARANDLYQQNQGITLTEVQKREGDLRTAEGALSVAEASLKAATDKLRLLGFDDATFARLEKEKRVDAAYVIRSPLRGEVTEREVTLGELVRPDQDALLVVADLRTVWVIGDVPEARLEAVRVGASARVTTVGMSAPYTGKVAFVSPTVAETTRTVQVRIEVPTEGWVLRPGQFAQVELERSDGAGSNAVIAVPTEALQNVEGATTVFVPIGGEAGAFAVRRVTVGAAVGGKMPVTAGLREGESVVTAGGFILKAELGKSSAAHDD